MAPHLSVFVLLVIFSRLSVMSMPLTEDTEDSYLTSAYSMYRSEDVIRLLYRLERTLFYLMKIVNAMLFLLCTIIAVVNFKVNRLRGEIQDS